MKGYTVFSADQISQQLELTEEGMTAHRLPVKELRTMIEAGDICDSLELSQVPLLLDCLRHRGWTD